MPNDKNRWDTRPQPKPDFSPDSASLMQNTEPAPFYTTEFGRRAGEMIARASAKAGRRRSAGRRGRSSRPR